MLTKKFLFDQNCEEPAFPQFFSKGRFGYSAERKIKLSPSKYFNQRLLNYKQSFASNSDYISFVKSVLQENNFKDQISIAIKKRWAILQQECLKTISILLKNRLTKIKTFNS